MGTWPVAPVYQGDALRSVFRFWTHVQANPTPLEASSHNLDETVAHGQNGGEGGTLLDLSFVWPLLRSSAGVAVDLRGVLDGVSDPSNLAGEAGAKAKPERASVTGLVETEAPENAPCRTRPRPGSWLRLASFGVRTGAMRLVEWRRLLERNLEEETRNRCGWAGLSRCRGRSYRRHIRRGGQVVSTLASSHQMGTASRAWEPPASRTLAVLLGFPCQCFSRISAVWFLSIGVTSVAWRYVSRR